MCLLLDYARFSACIHYHTRFLVCGRHRVRDLMCPLHCAKLATTLTSHSFVASQPGAPVMQVHDAPVHVRRHAIYHLHFPFRLTMCADLCRHVTGRSKQSGEHLEIRISHSLQYFAKLGSWSARSCVSQYCDWSGDTWVEGGRGQNGRLKILGIMIRGGEIGRAWKEGGGVPRNDRAKRRYWD